MILGDHILSVIICHDAHTCRYTRTFLQCPFDVSGLFTDGMQTSIQCRNKEQRLREWDWTSSLTLKEKPVKHLQISDYLKLNTTWYVARNTQNVFALESEWVCVCRFGYFQGLFQKINKNYLALNLTTLGGGYSKCRHLNTKTSVSIRGSDSLKGLCVFVFETTALNQDILLHSC